jgi:hypothetical protein
VSEVRQEGYAGPVSEEISERAAEDSTGNLDSAQGWLAAGGAGLVRQAQDSEPEAAGSDVPGSDDPGPEAGAGLVPDEADGQGVEPMDSADRAVTPTWPRRWRRTQRVRSRK